MRMKFWTYVMDLFLDLGGPSVRCLTRQPLKTVSIALHIAHHAHPNAAYEAATEQYRDCFRCTAEAYKYCKAVT